jgi:hypothetical protein
VFLLPRSVRSAPSCRPAYCDALLIRFTNPLLVCGAVAGRSVVQSARRRLLAYLYRFSLLLVFVGDRSVGVLPPTSLTPVVRIGGSMLSRMATVALSAYCSKTHSCGAAGNTGFVKFLFRFSCSLLVIDGHVDSVDRFLMPWTSNLISCLVVIVDGHSGTVHSCVRVLFWWWLQ